MITPRPHALTRLFAELLRTARRTQSLRRLQLKGGAELVALVQGDTVTLTIKRPRVRLSDTEIATFRRDCLVPPDAEVVSGPDQRTRQLELLWFYVTFRWRLPAEQEQT